MKLNRKFKYPPCSRSSTDGLRHYDIGKQKLPSVTTILQATMPEEKKQKLAEWRERVGAKKADDIRDSAATRGTAMHLHLEKYIAGKGHLDMTEMGQVSRIMAQKVIDEGLKEQLTEVWGSEVTLYYPNLYAGATDVVGIYNGRESILDFKQSNKLKRREWIEDYCIQLGAYGMAHNYVHRTKIDQGVILMCTPPPSTEFQCFVIKGKEFVKYQHEFLKRVDQYYEQIKKKK